MDKFPSYNQHNDMLTYQIYFSMEDNLEYIIPNKLLPHEAITNDE